MGPSIAWELLNEGAEVMALIWKSSDTRSINGLERARGYGDIRGGGSMKKAPNWCIESGEKK